MRETSLAKILRLSEKHVRTPGGVEVYHKPIGSVITSVRNVRANLKPLANEMTAQGIPDLAPIRGVVGHGSHTAVVRDGSGKIMGAIGYSVTRSQGKSYPGSIDIQQMHVLDGQKGVGVGRKLIEHLASQAVTYPRGEQYEMNVYGALETAIPFYAATGADFENRFSTIGRWSAAAMALLRAGKRPPPGVVADRSRGKSALA